MINFNEMPFNRFAEVMRKNGEYSQFYLLNTLAAARAGNVTAAVKAAFEGYENKPLPVIRVPDTKKRFERAAVLRKAAIDAGHATYRYRPCQTCKGTLRDVAMGLCVACYAVRQKARADELRSEITKFIDTHGMAWIQRVHGNGAKRLVSALSPDFDMSDTNVRCKLRKDMQTAVARFEGLNFRLDDPKEAKRQEKLVYYKERYKRQKDKKRQEMAA